MNTPDPVALLDELFDLDADAREARLRRIASDDAELAATLRRWLAADAREDARVDRGGVATLAVAAAAPPSDVPGTRIGAYRLVRELGRGGMGQVWLAERADGEFSQQVALKLIHPDLASPQAAPRFRRERQILAGLRHPHIAQLYDGGVTTDGRPWLAMEWIEGASLREEVRRGALTPRRATTIAAQIAEALAHAHSAGVVHRDLKPENVLLARDGYVKVLDFGIAKLLGDDAGCATQGATQPGMLLGTIAYMSPEQAAGQAIDFRSDQFALGAVLYELLTGRAAFARDGATATLRAVLSGEPEGLDGSDPALTPALRPLLQRCLAKDPGERYAATLDLAHDLRSIASGGSGPAMPIPVAKRNMRLAPIAAFVAGAALVFALAWLSPWPASTPANPPSVLRLRAQLPLAPAERLSFGTFPMHALALSPDGRRLAWTGTLDGVRMLFVRDLDGSEAMPLSGSEGAANPEFSPDGQWIAFFANQKLKKLAIAGGGAVEIAEAPNALGGIAWVAPDRILFSPHPSTGIWQIDANGDDEVQLTAPDPAVGEASHVWPARVPGSTRFLYVAEMESADSFDAGRIWSHDLASGARSLLIDGGSDPGIVGDTLHYARAGTIYAIGLSPDRTTTIGAPRAVHERVIYSPAIGAAQFAASEHLTVRVQGEHGWDRHELVVVDRDGGIEPLAVPIAVHARVRLSPDGRRALIQTTAADDDLWLYDFERRLLSRVTQLEENLHPTWMPDGEWVVYSHHGTPAPPPPTLWRRRADGGGTPEQLMAPGEPLAARLYADVAPDGRTVAYSEYTLQHNFELRLLDLETRTDRLWVSSPAADILPRFSPDGRWLAWVSAPRLIDPGQIHVQSVSGEGRRWQITTEGGALPAWRGDGRALYFLLRGTVYEVDVQPGDDLAPSAPRALFSGDYARFDAFPDGRRFLMVRRVPEPGLAGPVLIEADTLRP